MQASLLPNFGAERSSNFKTELLPTCSAKRFRAKLTARFEHEKSPNIQFDRKRFFKVARTSRMSCAILPFVSSCC